MDTNNIIKDEYIIDENVTMIKLEPEIKIEPEILINEFKQQENVMNLQQQLFVKDELNVKSSNVGNEFSDKRIAAIEESFPNPIIAIDRKEHKCNICGKLFKRADNLNTHKFTHSDDRPYKCHICENTFKQFSTLHRHVIMHTKEKYECQYCDKKFRQAISFKTHTQKEHGNDRILNDVYLRERDKNVIPRKRNQSVSPDYTDETKSIDTTSTTTIKTTTTTTTSPNSSLYTRHKKDLFKCKICNKFLTGKTTIYEHLLTHDNEVRHKCDICERTFKQKAQLRIHKLTHSDVKKYICNICGKSFHVPSSLRLHRVVHSEELPFKCTICDRSYKRKCGFKIHMATHNIDIYDDNFMENVEKFKNNIPTAITNATTFNPPVPSNYIDNLNNDKLLQIQSNELHQYNTNDTTIITNNHEQQDNTYIDIKPQVLQPKPVQTFNCRYCNKSFGSLRAVHNHEPYHTILPSKKLQKNQSLDESTSTTKTFNCRYCNKPFKSLRAVRNHEPYHIMLPRYQCKICLEKFKVKALIMRHILVHKNAIKITIPLNIIGKCKFCGISFHSKSTLYQHLLNIHNIGKSFKRNYTINNNYSNSNNINNSNINVKKENTDDFDIESHIIFLQESKPIVEEVIPVKIENVIKKKRRSRKPTRLTYSDKLKKYTCNLCNKTFTNSGNYNTHKILHTGVKSFFCDMCEERSFSSKKNLKQHIQNVHDKRIKICDLCGATFKSYATFYRHRKTHFVIRNENGDIVAMKKRKSQQPSQRSPPVKHLKCHYCDKMFSRRQYLNTHQLMHINADKFKCDLCPDTFHTEFLLNNHKKTYHSNKPILRCHLCNKGFTLKSSLGRHLYIHTGEKTFECDICFRRFAFINHCKNHRATHFKQPSQSTTTSTSSTSSSSSSSTTITTATVSEPVFYIQHLE